MKYKKYKQKYTKRYRNKLKNFTLLTVSVVLVAILLGEHNRTITENAFAAEIAEITIERPNREKEGWTIEEVKQIVSVVAWEEGIAQELMHYVAENESGYKWDNENPKDPRGGAIGTFQIILGWHPSVDAKCARDPWCSARYFAKKTKAGYCESLWTTCRNYYAL